MTTIQPDSVVVTPDAGTRLSDLHAAWFAAKAAADEASAQLKVVTDAIKAELTQMVPEVASLELASEGQRPLLLKYTERWTIDSKKLKADDPETYVKYAKKSGSWSLRAGGAS